MVFFWSSGISKDGAANTVRDPASSAAETLPASTQGNAGAIDRLLPLAYAELRRLARHYMKRERPDHTLQPTALVHEAYLKLVDQTRVEAGDRTHFLAIAARVMRQVIIDYARTVQAAKRGGGESAVSLDRLQVGADGQADRLLAIDVALEKLNETSRRLGLVFECRYFGGLTEQETSDALGVPLLHARQGT